MGNLTAVSWHPTVIQQPPAASPGGLTFNGCQVDAGDWVQVTVSWPSSNTDKLSYTPGNFLFHAIYTPNTDDSTPHEDMATTYGGSPTAVNRRPNYHVDPNVWFQVPSTGQVSVVCGGDNPNITVNVLIRRQHVRRDWALLQEQLSNLEQQAAARALILSEEQALAELALLHSPVTMPKALPIWPPPIVGTPQLVPCTYIDIPQNTAFPVPDGAVQVIATVTTGAPPTLAPPRFTFTVMGQTLGVDLPFGIPSWIGMLAQGFACSDGVVATWQSSIALQTVTFLSSLGG